MIDTLLFYLLISLLLNLLFFIPAFMFKTDLFTDMTYSLTFITLILYSYFSNQATLLKQILLVMVLIWALRIGGFLAYRVYKFKKDQRFDPWRNSILKFGKFWLFQAIFVWIVLINSFLFLASNQKTYLLLNIIGVIVWFLGFLLETIADIQKFKFKLNPKNKDKWIEEGVWELSRHPNYLGEMMCWIGIYIFTFSISTTALISLISPIAIVLLLLYGSGIPMLEKSADKKWGKNKDYQKYKKRVPTLIPKI